MSRGFSIVELIVIIVVLGILSGIIVVSYNGVQQKANDTAVTADLEQMADQFDIFRTRSTTDAYPASKDDLEPLDINVTNIAYNTSILANVFACVAGDYKSFAIVAQSKSGNIFMVTNTSNVTPFTQPASSFSYANTCPSLGMGLASAGWYSGSSATPGPWRDWAGGN